MKIMVEIHKRKFWELLIYRWTLLVLYEVIEKTNKEMNISTWIMMESHFIADTNYFTNSYQL